MTEALPSTLTWWGASSIELDIAGDRLLIDPYIEPAGSNPRYICVTREDYDHCHEPTLRKLVAQPAFEKLVVSAGCLELSKLDSPVNPNPADLDFVPRDQIEVLYPKYTRAPHSSFPGQSELELGPYLVEAVDSSEREPISTLDRWPRYRPEDGTSWPAATGDFSGIGTYPPLGYVITHRPSGLTFYHPGDLQEVFDGHRELRERVDYMFLPLPTVEGIEQLLINAVRPAFVVPIQYRTDDPSFPIELRVTSDQVKSTEFTTGAPISGAGAEDYRSDIQTLIEGQWYSTPRYGLKRFNKVSAALEQLGSKPLVLDAGRPHELDRVAA